MILRVMYESGGFGVAVSDEDVEVTRRAVAEDDGMLLSPEGAACVAAYQAAIRSGQVKPEETCVAFNTATGLRTPMPTVKRHVDITRPIDFPALLRS